MIYTVTLNPAVDKLYVIDSLTPYEVMRVKEVNNTAGGKGMNVARVAALAGEKTTAMGFVGGHNGVLFESFITEKNIKSKFTKIDGETRCCINARDIATNHSTEFLEPGCPVSEKNLEQFLKDFETSIDDASVITISGSTPVGTPDDFYSKLVKIAKSKGKKIILDTSGNSLINSISSKPTMIKPNSDEIKQLLNVDINSREELIEAAEKLHEGGIEIVVVSLGKEGALIVCNEGVFQGITPDIPVVNTVGCGDSMVAGFAVGMARGYSIQETIKFAVAVSTANALTRETGSFKRDDLEKLLYQVSVKTLKLK